MPPPSSRPGGPVQRGAVALLSLMAVSAAPPASRPVTSPSVDPAVASLVRQLRADADADRSAAQQGLVDLGTTAIDALRVASHDADPEVRTRAMAALAQIDERLTNGPTLISLHVADADARAVFARIGDAAHAELIAPLPTALGLGKSRVTIDADRRPFWDVFADACGQAGLCPLLDGPRPDAIRLVAADRNWMRSSPRQIVGPFWVSVAGVYRLSSVDLSGPPTTDEQFLARLVVFAEPKLTVTQVSPLAVREATDDAGHSLVPPTANPVARALARAATRLPARTVEARLKYPADGRAGRRIATLAGDLAITLARGAQPFEVDDLMGRPTVTRSLPGVRARVGVVRADADAYRVTIDCRRDQVPDDAWYAMVNRVGDLAVLDDAGRPLTPLGWTLDSANTLLSFKATGLFARTAAADVRLTAPPTSAATVPAPTGEPRKISWAVATRFKVVVVPVEFHDLPMP